MKEIQETIHSFQQMMNFNIKAAQLLQKLSFHHNSQAKPQTPPVSKKYQKFLAGEIDTLLKINHLSPK